MRSNLYGSERPPPQCCRLPSSAVDLASMRGADDRHRERIVEDVVDHAIVTYSDSPGGLFSDEHLRPMRPRVLSEVLDGIEYTITRRTRKLLHLARC